ALQNPGSPAPAAAPSSAASAPAAPPALAEGEKQPAAANDTVIGLQATGGGGSQRRVALIISNSNYRAADIAALPNPKNDADLIASILRRIGFQSVEVRADLTREQMIRALQEFAVQAD